MHVKIIDQSYLPGIGSIDYKFNNDHVLLAQHNYMYYTKPSEISFRGWYDPKMMKACETIVAVWHIKQRH